MSFIKSIILPYSNYILVFIFVNSTPIRCYDKKVNYSNNLIYDSTEMQYKNYKPKLILRLKIYTRK